MRNLVMVFAAVAGLCSFGALADDEATLRHFKTVLWPQAYRTQDVELLDSMLHESFEVIDGTGEVSRKQDELDFIANNEWDPGDFEFHIDRLDIYDGKTAIISGTGIATSYTYKSSNVLIKEDGRWRAVSSHVSGLRDREAGE